MSQKYRMSSLNILYGFVNRNSCFLQNAQSPFGWSLMRTIGSRWIGNQNRNAHCYGGFGPQSGSAGHTGLVEKISHHHQAGLYFRKRWFRIIKKIQMAGL